MLRSVRFQAAHSARRFDKDLTVKISAATAAALAALLFLSGSPVAAAAPEDTQADAAQPVAAPDEHGYYKGARIYVSDQVNALLRSGPGSSYRTVGVLHPGDEVLFSRYSSDGKFIEVKIPDGRTVWMRFGDLQAKPAARALLSELQEENERLKQQLDDAVNALNAAKQPVAEPPAPPAEETAKDDAAAAAEENPGTAGAELGAALEKLRQENEDLRAELAAAKEATKEPVSSEGCSTRDLDLQMRWWLQGALIALGGFIAGLIFVALPKPRRRRTPKY